MKKLVLVTVLLAAAYAAWRAYTADQDERDLWAEVTDSVA